MRDVLQVPGQPLGEPGLAGRVRGVATGPVVPHGPLDDPVAAGKTPSDRIRAGTSSITAPRASGFDASTTAAADRRKAASRVVQAAGSLTGFGATE